MNRSNKYLWCLQDSVNIVPFNIFLILIYCNLNWFDLDEQNHWGEKNRPWGFRNEGKMDEWFYIVCLPTSNETFFSCLSCWWSSSISVWNCSQTILDFFLRKNGQQLGNVSNWFHREGFSVCISLYYFIGWISINRAAPVLSQLLSRIIS